MVITAKICYYMYVPLKDDDDRIPSVHKLTSLTPLTLTTSCPIEKVQQMQL